LIEFNNAFLIALNKGFGLPGHADIELMKHKISMAFIVVAIMSLALAVSQVFGGNNNGVEKAKQAQEKVNQKVLSKKMSLEPPSASALWATR
jgi:hypothetical protein